MHLTGQSQAHPLTEALNPAKLKPGFIKLLLSSQHLSGYIELKMTMEHIKHFEFTTGSPVVDQGYPRMRRLDISEFM